MILRNSTKPCGSVSAALQGVAKVGDAAEKFAAAATKAADNMANDHGKELTEGMIAAGKELNEGISDAGKEVGKELKEGISDAGKWMGIGIGSGIGIGIAVAAAIPAIIEALKSTKT